MATAKQLDNITECPICTEVYTDPRILPCVHTYCLKCIETWSKDKQPGDKLACPMCREEFTLPSNGVSDLPKNLFVASFSQMKEWSNVESTSSLFCEACSGGEENESGDRNVASVYCVECQMKLCRICDRGHKAIKLTRSHTLLQLGDKIDVEKLYKSLAPAYCDQHKTEDTKIYCFDCKSTICTMCYMESHKTHSCSDISKVEDDFRKQMARDAEKTVSGVEKCREMIERLEKEKNDFSEQVAKTEIKIGKKAEQMKQLIDAHKDRLMVELASVKEKRMKEIESLREEIEMRLLSMESYKKYVDEVREKGTACDVARAASGLHDRADELFTFDAIERTLVDLGNGYVTFSSSRDDICRAIGQLRVNSAKEAVKSNAPTLTHVISSQGVPCAVASLDDDVFVARSNSQQIEVYNATTFALRHNLSVYGIGVFSGGLAACAHHASVYASGINNRVCRIYRVKLPGRNATKNWTVANNPQGLSVNSAHNVVVACDEERKLQEYTTRGVLVREISLLAAFISPWHAVQLSTGDYVVGCGSYTGTVSIIGVDGHFVHMYGQSYTSDVGDMRYPKALAVTSNDDILVKDEDKILIINRSLDSIQKLALSGGENNFQGLCLDESRGRLYLCEKYRGRILVFDGVQW